MENNSFSCCVFLDFAKAFDTVNHDILLSKLEHYGIRGVANKWFKSYLYNRPQTVKIGNEKSEELYIRSGVPQGSVLGPLLFLIYINDLPEHVSVGHVHLYADDTTFYYIDRNTEEVIDALNIIGRDVGRWCEKNKMTIHTDKSEVMLITKQDFIGPKRPVKINGETIKYVNSTTSLGIVIDNHLKWDIQVERVCKSFRAKVSQLKRMSYLPIEVQEDIYFKTIISAVTYGILTWGTCSQALTTKLEQIHIRAAKIIHKLPKRIGDEDVLTNAKWTNLLYIYKRKLLTFMHNVQTQQCPKDFFPLFERNCSRYAKKETYVLPSIKTEKGRTSVRFRGPLLWNQIPESLRLEENTKTFKQSLRTIRDLILQMSFNKESSLITNKNKDFIYF